MRSQRFSDRCSYHLDSVVVSCCERRYIGRPKQPLPLNTTLEMMRIQRTRSFIGITVLDSEHQHSVWCEAGTCTVAAGTPQQHTEYTGIIFHFIEQFLSQRSNLAYRHVGTRQTVNRGTPSRNLPSAAAVSVTRCESRTGENPRMAYYTPTEHTLTACLMQTLHVLAAVRHRSAALRRYGAESECGGERRGCWARGRRRQLGVPLESQEQTAVTGDETCQSGLASMEN